MIPEIGQFALGLALALSLVQGSVPFAGAARANGRWMALAPRAALGVFALVALAFGCLAFSFLAYDFSVEYVARHSNTLLPFGYRIAAVWGGHEGSFLLWVLMLSGWGCAVCAASRDLRPALRAHVLATLGLVTAGFLSFLLFASNPFTRIVPAALEGNDLNPLLQDPGMAIHPPLLYMGYVGFSVAFAFAIAQLLGRREDAGWARHARPWTLAAWAFLTLGIALGSAWAYYELGWGGWWFWDPVENASFLPWLVGAALAHSLAVTERRGAFQGSSLLLAITAFALSLLGTFLVRSGVLTSVHAFATDPRRGAFILVLLALVAGGSLALYAWRAPRERPAAVAPVSREAFLLANNLLLAAAAATVLLGTLYPLAIDALGLGKLSVGPPYFETVFPPLGAAVVFLAALGPLARWRKAALPDMARRLRWAAAVALASGIATPLLMGQWKILTALGVLLGVWLVAASVVAFVGRLRSAGPTNAHWGLLFAHAGLGVFVLGTTLVKSYESVREAPLAQNAMLVLGGYEFRLDDVTRVPGPNYVATRARLTVRKDGRDLVVLEPERRFYAAQESPMTEAAIDRGFARDLYAALGEPLPDGSWIVRAQVKPFINWIWFGWLMMAFGAMLSILRRRTEKAPAAAAATAPA